LIWQYLWGSLDGKYLPSILYKVRMVTFDTGEIVGRVPTVGEPKLGGCLKRIINGVFSLQNHHQLLN